MGLARGNAEVPQGYYETYYDNVRVTVKEKDGVLDERRYTEYARVAIALNAIGKDPTAVEGYNLLKNLDNTKAVEAQGINGPIWALIAAGVCEYELKNEQRYLQAILDAELAEGGFSLMEEEEASPDLSGMALQALSFYPGNEEACLLYTSPEAVKNERRNHYECEKNEIQANSDCGGSCGHGAGNEQRVLCGK